MFRKALGLLIVVTASTQTFAATNSYLLTCSGIGSYGVTDITVTLDMNKVEKTWNTHGVSYVSGTGQVQLDGFESEAEVTFATAGLFGGPLGAETAPLSPEAEFSISANVSNQSAEIVREGVVDRLSNVKCSSNIITTGSR